jgi:hypothetical protein
MLPPRSPAAAAAEVCSMFAGQTEQWQSLLCSFASAVLRN